MRTTHALAIAIPLLSLSRGLLPLLLLLLLLLLRSSNAARQA